MSDVCATIATAAVARTLAQRPEVVGLIAERS
jgi:hypothetical protein